MALVNLPDWASSVLERAGMKPGEDVSGLLAATLSRQVPARVSTAAGRLASELAMRETLIAERAMLEAEQVELHAASGRHATSETHLGDRRITAYRWAVPPAPDAQALYRAIVLLDVAELDDLQATMALNSRRASVHFECFELAHDNQVIGFHNAALRSRSASQAPKTAVGDREGDTQ